MSESDWLTVHSLRQVLNTREGSSVLLFTAPCYSNGAVLPSYDVRLSVRLSVTMASADHIR